MELTPRLQDIVNILKNKGSINVKDLALEIKVSPKTAKGYARELQRLGLVDMDQDGNIRLKENKVEHPDSEKLLKTLENHENEITLLKKEIEAIKGELEKLKKKGKA
ncbi:winged helix-turn-helix transcriptional regulator [Saccharolobus shibatae]|uniref:Putative transcriptional regulator n=1 Tax=Saccharolobus shibatae TaxID=2286 RepID=A0A8F5BYJ5_9CREN|nr:HTH domain-containing protein [Saccharolobus shibatae]QXJ30697.1 putative transcriptional regulator [Saccharolobus shibatae]QXJ33725.1 putative transcriptional regulator [Saccharolobus shibatae]